LGLAATWRNDGREDDIASYRAAVEGERRHVMGKHVSKDQTQLARKQVIDVLKNLLNDPKPDFNVLQSAGVALFTQNTIDRLNTDSTPEARKAAAKAYIKMLEALVMRPNGARVAQDHNNGGVQHGSRFQRFRVR
jgi:hypothetical protein